MLPGKQPSAPQQFSGLVTWRPDHKRRENHQFRTAAVLKYGFLRSLATVIHSGAISNS